jgi:hypothetical protein
LKDILKFTNSASSDFEQLPKAIDFLNSTLTDINKSINKEDLEQAKKVLEAEKTIDGDFEVQRLTCMFLSSIDFCTSKAEIY